MGYSETFLAGEVGFNKQVDRGERSFHVQTEVAGRKDRYVRTTVLEGGTLLFSERQPYPDESDLGRFRAAVQAHHKRVVEMVERDEIS